MAGVYVYAHDCQDFTTTGLAGDLRPAECLFEEEKNGLSQITMALVYDDLGKWKHVQVGRYLKAKVPVRVPPVIADDAYATVVKSYKVIEQPQTYNLRAARALQVSNKIPLFFNSKALDYGAPHALLGIGDVVFEKKQTTSGSGLPKGIYAPGKGSGVVKAENLEYIEDVTIPACLNGLETVTGTVRLMYQYFIITEVIQDLNGISVTAQHVFYELLNNYTTYKTENTVQGAAACVQVLENLVNPDERFSILSDCKDTVKGIDLERYNAVQALLDPDNGICARYGLSLLRDNYDLYALKNVGTDRGFVVEYSKNMLAIERTENIENTVTRIIPYGKDKKGELVFMDGTMYVDSPHMDEYPAPRVQYLDCSDTATESKEMTLAQVKAELKARADAEFAAGCDLPEMSMVVEFISLGDTEEYRQYRDLDKVYLYDLITVKDKVRGYDYSAQVVAVTHNVLTGMLESVTLGSIQKGTGVRKIPTWQVPEVDGANIRLKSIAPGILGEGSVTEETLQDGIINKAHIKDATIDTAKIEDAAITSAKIALLAVENANIADLAVTAAKIAEAAISTAHIQNAAIDTAKIALGAITSALIAQGAIGTVQIADGSITDAKIVELTANKINAGTLSVERLIISGSDQSIIYAINNMGQLVSQQVDTIDAYVLTERTITADKIVAGAITSNEIAAKTITANNILSGAITTELLAALCITADKIAAGTITVDKLQADVGKRLNLEGNESIKLAVVKGVNNSAMTLTEEEMTVAFDGHEVMSITEEAAAFDVDVLSATGQIIGNVVNTQKAGSVTVKSGASIQSAIDNLGKYLLGNVYVYVEGQHTENVLIQGFYGIGNLYLSFRSGAILSGSIDIRYCKSVSIIGPSQTECCFLSTAENGIYAYGVERCNIYLMNMYGGGRQRGIYCLYTPGVYIEECTLAGFVQGVYITSNSQASMYNCIGGGTGNNALSTYAVAVGGGAMMTLYGSTRPVGALNDSNGAGLLRDAGTVETNASGQVPVVSSTKTVTPASAYGCVSATAAGNSTLVHDWGYYANPFQGKYQAAGGYMHGIWIYNASDITALQSAIASKTVETATVTIKRADAYGTDGKTVRLWYHDKTAKPSGSWPSAIFTDTGLTATVDRGKSVTFTLTSDLITKLKNGTIKGFGISSMKNTDLMQFDSSVCDLTVIYK